MEKNASGIPIEQAATELGVPADALRLYVSAHRLSDPASASIAQAQVSDLKEELRSRAGALRLDDLSKTALTIEWLAAAAGETARATDRLETTVAELGKRVSDKKGEDLAAKLDPIGKRIDALEAHSSEASGAAVQLVGSIQGMVESQGRELDALRADVSNLRSDVATLRSDIASLRLAVHGAEAKHQALL